MKKRNLVIKKILTLTLSAMLTVSMVMPASADELLTEDTLITDESSNLLIDTSEDVLLDEASDTAVVPDKNNIYETVYSETSEVSDIENNYDYHWILENDPGVIWMPINGTENTTSLNTKTKDDTLDSNIMDIDIHNDKVSQINVIHEWPNTQLTKEEREWTINRVKQIVAENITDDMSDLEKYWTLAHWVKNNISYPDLDSDFYKNRIYAHDTLHGPYGTLKYGYGVCQGNTLLYSLLCHAAGLPCDEVPTIKKVNHILNYVPNINGHSYYIDITANDFLASDIAIQPCYNMFPDVSKTYKGYIDADNITCNDNSFVFKESADFDINNIGYSITKNMPAPIKFGELSYSYIFENLIKSDDALTIDTYVEKGSGTPGVHYAHYADYALQEPSNTGNWELDDFYENPKDELRIKLSDATFTGLKNKYGKYKNEDDYITAIKNDVTVTYNDTILEYGKDYTIRLDLYESCDFGTVTFIGIGNYKDYIEKQFDIGKETKINEVRNTKTLDASVFSNASITYKELAKGTEDSDSYIISVTDSSVATINNKGVITGKKVGSTTATVTKLKTVYTVNITVNEPESLSKDIVIIVGGKITDTTFAKKSVDGCDYKITYSNKGIANVNEKGQIQGKKTGSTVATITRPGGITTLNITVINPVFNAKSYNKNVGDEFTTGFDAQGLDVTYTSNKPAIATVDENGTVTAVSKGSATITAIVQGKKYNVGVKVYDPMIFAKNTVLLTNNKTESLSIKNGSGKTQWSSSNPAVVIVDGKGKIKGISKGTATITAVNNGREMNIDITVYNVPKFEQKVYTTNTDEPIEVVLTKDEDMDGVIYTVNNTKIATIDENGLVTPLKKGAVTVSAKVAGKTYKTKVKIQ